MSLPKGEEYLEQFVIRNSQRSCFLTLRSVEARLLGSRVRISLSKWMFVSSVCCVVTGLCNKLITRSEGSYRVCVCLIVCDLETSIMRLPRPDLGF